MLMVDIHLYSKNVLRQPVRIFGLKIETLPNDIINVLRDTGKILGDHSLVINMFSGEVSISLSFIWYLLTI